MPESVERPQEFAGEGYTLELGNEFAHVNVPYGRLMDTFSLWGRLPLEGAVAPSCRSHRDRSDRRHGWLP